MEAIVAVSCSILHPVPEDRFEPGGEDSLPVCGKPRGVCPRRFKIRHTYRVFDCGMSKPCSLVRPFTLSGETLTSMDHYAEGPGRLTWWTIWRMQARAAHNQTTERVFMIAQPALLPALPRCEAQGNRISRQVARGGDSVFAGSRIQAQCARSAWSLAWVPLPGPSGSEGEIGILQQWVCSGLGYSVYKCIQKITRHCRGLRATC